MKDEHTASREVMRDLWKNGIPMARKVDEDWIPVFPKGHGDVSTHIQVDAEVQSKI